MKAVELFRLINRCELNEEEKVILEATLAHKIKKYQKRIQERESYKLRKKLVAQSELLMEDSYRYAYRTLTPSSFSKSS